MSALGGTTGSSGSGADGTPDGGPLAGVRVLDLTSVLMGPYATQVLGDLGADVISVEPAGGDPNRSMGEGPHPQLSGVALNLLRNKRNIALNFKVPEGYQALIDIAATCDVFVTNLRPSTLRRARLEYADLCKRRPDIVFCQAHGYPSDGPRGDDPAYDDVLQAETGLADAMSRTTGSPTLAATVLVDKVCGLFVASSVMAALYRRAITGEGQKVEVPMVEVASAFTLVEHGAAAIPRPALGPAGYGRVLTPARRPWPTKDGWIMVLPYTKQQFDAVFDAGGRHDLLGDDRYSTGRNRVLNAPFLYEQVGLMLAERTTDEWLVTFKECDVPAASVARLDDMVDALPEAEHPHTGTYKVIPPAVRFSASPQKVRRPAPLIGEHTEEVLAEAGYDADRIAGLLGAGAFPKVPEEFAET